MSVDDSGPAFPTEPNTQKGFYSHQGMSLRDYIAAKAMVAVGSTLKPSSGASLEDVIAELARISYLVADAMIAQRSKGRAETAPPPPPTFGDGQAPL
ncbi:MAG: hypothetical protein M9944_12820 [Rhizobiaceae bacterium]|nr:hypothetical protein [Rhizobiaceae bacterium]